MYLNLTAKFTIQISNYYQASDHREHLITLKMHIHKIKLIYPLLAASGTSPAASRKESYLGMRRPLLKPSMLTLSPFRKIQAFSNILHSQDVLHANAEKVIRIMRTQQRRREVAIRGNQEYSDLSISWPIAPSIAAVVEGAISATRCIHIRDGFLPSTRCAEICSLVANSNLQHFFTSGGERKVWRYSLCRFILLQWYCIHNTI